MKTLHRTLTENVPRPGRTVRRKAGRAAALAAACGLLLGGLGLGQAGPPPAPRVLTLAEALALADAQNKDIQKAREYRRKVQGRYLEERAAALPQVTISSSASRASDESQKAFGGGLFEEFDFPVSQTLYAAEVGVSQALFTWGQVGAAIRAAREGIAMAEDQLDIYRQAVVRDVSAAYYNVLLAKELHALATQNLELKQRHLDEARRKYEAGLATDYDVLAWEVDVQNARPAVIRADNAIRAARERLRFLVGLEGQEVDALGGLDASVGPFPEYGPSLEVARRNRPEITDLEHQEGIARELVKIYGAGNKPRLDFKGGLGWRYQDIGGGSADGLAWSAGVYLTFPAYDGGRTAGKVMQAQSDLATLGIEKARLLDSIALQVRQSVDAVQEAGLIVEALSGTVTQADRLLYMAEKGFEYGAMTRLDIDDAQLNLLRAKSNLTQARHDYLVASVTLEWVMGRLQPTAGR